MTEPTPTSDPQRPLVPVDAVDPAVLEGDQPASSTPRGDGAITRAVHRVAGDEQGPMNGPELVVVAIDGPSGSGKSSVSRDAAHRLHYGYLDTGAMYRALAWYCLDQGIALDDAARVPEAATTMPLELGSDPANPTVHVGGTDIGEAIREPRISTVVSQVATNLDVRAELGRRQRAIIGRVGRQYGGVVAEGRDITTVVAPDADVRILLVASEEARLRRRSAELYGSADAAAVAATRDQVVRRDQQDATVSSFMEAAPGVTLIDSSDLSFEATVQAVLDEIAEQTGRQRS